MAASIQFHPHRPFKQDPHWLKFKAIVCAMKTEEAARFLIESYGQKPIEEKLDHLLIELIDTSQYAQIIALASAMRRAGRMTHLAYAARLGAAIHLNDPFRVYSYGNQRASAIARDFAAAFQSQGWQERTAFMEKILSS